MNPTSLQPILNILQVVLCCCSVYLYSFFCFCSFPHNSLFVRHKPQHPFLWLISLSLVILRSNKAWTVKAFFQPWPVTRPNTLAWWASPALEPPPLRVPLVPPPSVRELAATHLGGPIFHRVLGSEPQRSAAAVAMSWRPILVRPGLRCPLNSHQVSWRKDLSLFTCVLFCYDKNGRIVTFHREEPVREALVSAQDSITSERLLAVFSAGCLSQGHCLLPLPAGEGDTWRQAWVWVVAMVGQFRISLSQWDE